MKMKLISKLFLVVACVILLGSAVQAQDAVEITGSVTDTSGGILPGVEVTLTNPVSGYRTVAVTNMEGIYRQIVGKAGTYTIEAQLPGFKTAVAVVALGTGSTTSVDLSLEVGEISEQVTVEATGITLDKSKAAVSTFFEQKIVSNMPMIYRRSNMLLSLSAATANASPHIDNPMYTANVMAGIPNPGQEYYMDGGYTSSSRANQQIMDYASNLETTQEFRVVQNSYKAEHSGGGGLIIITTKSGTNNLHGSIWEYHRQRSLTSRSYFAASKEPFREHLAGMTIGGPIMKDKLHYFFAFETKFNWQNSNSFQTIPTIAQKGGDFSGKTDSAGALRTIYDPFSTVTAADGTISRTAFPGNIIPAARLSSISKAIMAFIPDANKTPADSSGSLNFQGQSQKIRRVYDWMGRVDGQWGENDKVFSRFSIARWRAESEGAWPGLAGFPAIYAARPESSFVNKARSKIEDINPADPGGRPDLWRSTNFTNGWTHTFGAELIMDVRSSYQRMEQWAAGASQGMGYPAQFGIPIPSRIDTKFDHFPAIIVDDGYTMPSAGWGGGGHSINPRDATHFGNTLAWLQGNHSLKLGGEVRYSRHRYFRHPYSGGRYHFTKKSTAATQFDAASGDSIASFLLDFPNAGDIWSINERRFYSWYYSYFIQDDWRVSPNLVVNLGMRYEYDSPVDEHTDAFTGFDMNRTNPACNCPGIITFPETTHIFAGAHKPNRNNWQPRIGFAWNPEGGKTVVRAGAGVYFMPPYTGMGPWNTIGGSRPDVGLQRIVTSADNGVTRPYAGMAAGIGEIPAFTPSDLNADFGAVAIGTAPIMAPDFLDPNHKAPRTYQVSFTVQHELEHFLLEAGWIANLTRHYGTWGPFNLNQIAPENLNATNTQSDRPYPQFGNVEQRSPGGSINYHGMILKMEKRFGGGFGFISNFTWAKHLQQTTNRHDSFYLRHLTKGPAQDQRRMRFVWGGTYEFPLGTNRRWVNEGMAAHMFGGWNIGAIFQAQAGQPLTFWASPNTTNSFGGRSRPNLVTSVKETKGERTIDSWSNMGAFEHPGDYVFGNAGTGLTEGPGSWLLDLSLTKDFVWGEGRSVRIGADFFNALNRVNWGNPSTSVCPAASPCTTNIIRSAHDARRIQMSLTIRF